jgi:hypothetical protein
VADERFSPEVDEEEQHYAQVRAETMRDLTRKRKFPKWETPTVIAQWSCRNAECRKPVDLTPEGGDMFALFNRILRGRGEQAMDSSRVLICPDCRTIAEHNREQKSRDRRRDIAVAIRALKASKDPEGEAALRDEIERLGHPDVKGLVEALKAKGGKRRVSKEDV